MGSPSQSSYTSSPYPTKTKDFTLNNSSFNIPLSPHRSLSPGKIQTSLPSTIEYPSQILEHGEITRSGTSLLRLRSHYEKERSSNEGRWGRSWGRCPGPRPPSSPSSSARTTPTSSSAARARSSSTARARSSSPATSRSSERRAAPYRRERERLAAWGRREPHPPGGRLRRDSRPQRRRPGPRARPPIGPGGFSGSAPGCPTTTPPTSTPNVMTFKDAAVAEMMVILWKASTLRAAVLNARAAYPGSKFDGQQVIRKQAILDDCKFFCASDTRIFGSLTPQETIAVGYVVPEKHPVSLSLSLQSRRNQVQQSKVHGVLPVILGDTFGVPLGALTCNVHLDEMNWLLADAYTTISYYLKRIQMNMFFSNLLHVDRTILIADLKAAIGVFKKNVWEA